MLPLLIRMRHNETGVAQEAGFKRSPVRLGRSHLNDLTIEEGIVSQWHGIIRFDDNETRYLDVGSSNGTTYNGDRLESKEEVILGDEPVLEIGPISLTLVRTELRADQVKSRRESSFQLSTAGPAAESNARTVMLGEAGPESKPPRAVSNAPAAPAPAGPPIAGAPSVAPARVSSDDNAATLMRLPSPAASAPPPSHAPSEALQPTLDRLRPLHEAYAKARGELEKAMAESLATVRMQPGVGAAVKALHEQAPLAFEIPGMRERAGMPKEDVDVSAWLERLAPAATAPASGQNIQSMERAGALLEAFAMGLVELGAAQRELMQRVGVESSSEGSTLQRIDNPRELLAYLLDPRTVAADQISDVTRAFADVALHQVGMLNGAMEGARAVLWELSPHQLGAAKPGALAKRSPGIGDFLWPFTAVGYHYRYVAKHTDLGVGDRLTNLLFGTKFARAYDRVTGAQSARKS